MKRLARGESRMMGSWGQLVSGAGWGLVLVPLTLALSGVISFCVVSFPLTLALSPRGRGSWAGLALSSEGRLGFSELAVFASELAPTTAGGGLSLVWMMSSSS